RREARHLEGGRDRPRRPRVAEAARLVARVEQRREGQAVVAVVREDAARVLAVGVDGEELRLAGERLRELPQVRRLGVAVRAPGREELEQDGLAAELRQAVRRSLRRLQ